MAECFSNGSQAFNTDEAIPLISYSCIAYLMDNNELIWKLLKDKTPESWNIADLTRTQKAELIYNGKGDMNNFNVFMDDYNDDAINVETTILRIFPILDVPANHLITSVDIGMSVYTHTNLNHLSNYETRIERIIQQLKKTFNGVDVPKAGRLIYSQERSRACKTTMIGRIPYKGKLIVFNTISTTV